MVVESVFGPSDKDGREGCGSGSVSGQPRYQDTRIIETSTDDQ